MPPYAFVPPFYPIVYVRGFSPTAGSRESNFHDLYYGYADTSVEPRPKPPADTANPETDRVVLDLFEGQLIRFLKEFAYVDASHGGLDMAIQNNNIDRPPLNPTRSIWVSRFYDQDYLTGKVRPITDHATDLWRLINVEMPAAFKNLDIPTDDFKVILIAHSMGGLVCRNLIQQLLPSLGVNPKDVIHRLATIATPHGGVEMGTIPDAFQNFVVNTFNPGGSNIFKSPMMRKYLNLEQTNAKGDFIYPINSLGDPQAQYAFPVQNCFCLIGSDHKDYGVVQQVTGGYSDGLVKQNLAFIDGAFTANVHRSHSGYRGIVNSIESYENIHRFLFGDTVINIHLDEVKIEGERAEGAKDYYNFEFNLSVRNTGVYLHQRREDPCENALRRNWDDIPDKLPLHTAFLNTKRRPDNESYMHFELGLRVVEHQVAEGLLWDKEYPGRTIFSESLQIRINGDRILGVGPKAALPLVDYQWLSETVLGKENWKEMDLIGDSFAVDLRKSASLTGKLRFTPAAWDNAATNVSLRDDAIDAALRPAVPVPETHPSLFERLIKTVGL